MTGQVTFDSHVFSVLTAAVQLVNRLTDGHHGSTVFVAPTAQAQVDAVADALSTDGRPRPTVSSAEAKQLAEFATRMRIVFEAVHAGDLDAAAREVNRMLLDTNARPQLDRGGTPGWSLHFHGADDTLANGWSAGCAAGLALALGSTLAGRLGICAAPLCDRTFVDTSRNNQRRFCSPQCQSRVKAATHRSRRSPTPT